MEIITTPSVGKPAEGGQGVKKKLKVKVGCSDLTPFLKGRWVGIDNKGDIIIRNNLTPLIPLSLQGEGEGF